MLFCSASRCHSFFSHHHQRLLNLRLNNICPHRNLQINRILKPSKNAFVQTKTPTLFHIGLGIASLGSVGACTILRDGCRAHCEYKPKKTRLEGIREEETHTDAPFPWREFFKLLWPDIWLLIGAIAVGITNDRYIFWK